MTLVIDYYYGMQDKNLFKITLTFFLAIGGLHGLSAQLTVSGIQFQGQKKTKENYLQRFLSHQSNQEFSLPTLEEEIQKLKNLSAVSNATYQLDTINNEVQITYQVEEALTIFPIINFGGVEGNFWYQLGFTDLNFLGNGMQLTTFYQNNDRRHNFSIYYRVPYLLGRRFGASFSVLKWASREPLFFDEGTVLYDYDNWSAGLSGIYEIAFNHQIEFGGTYFIEKYTKVDNQPLENPPGPEGLRQPKFLLKLFHSLNRIDYHYFYLWGFENSTNAQAVFNLDDQSKFYIIWNDTRWFRRVGEKGNFAARFRLGLSTNVDSPFAPFVLDSNVNIRGSGNRIDRGTGVAVLNLEYRQTLCDFPRWAVQAVGFSDTGTWRNPGGDYSDLIQRENIRPFIGGGIRVIYKKAFDAVLRLDYGVDIKNTNERGLVLGFGQYF